MARKNEKYNFDIFWARAAAEEQSAVQVPEDAIRAGSMGARFHSGALPTR